MLPLWMGLQLLALLLAVDRVPLWARMPQPIEHFATMEMAIVQVIAAALLFPSLFKDATRGILIAASVWPMLRLAGLLGGESDTCIYAAAGYVTIWITALALWRKILSCETSRMIAGAAANLWTIGGPILLYLHAEYGGGSWPSDRANGIWAAAGGPVWGVLDRLWGGRAVVGSDVPLAVILFCGILAVASRNLHRSDSADRLSP